MTKPVSPLTNDSAKWDGVESEMVFLQGMTMDKIGFKEQPVERDTI